MLSRFCRRREKNMERKQATTSLTKSTRQKKTSTWIKDNLNTELIQ